MEAVFSRRLIRSELSSGDDFPIASDNSKFWFFLKIDPPDMLGSFDWFIDSSAPSPEVRWQIWHFLTSVRTQSGEMGRWFAIKSETDSQETCPIQ